MLGVGAAMGLAAVGRKKYMFFGSDAGGHRAAIIYSLVASCKLIGLGPFAYLRDVISTACDPAFDRFADLTPAAWKDNHPKRNRRPISPGTSRAGKNEFRTCRSAGRYRMSSLQPIVSK